MAYGVRVLYEVLIIIWIIFGLGYIFMVISLLTSGFIAPAKKAAQKFREAEKQLMTKIMHEVVALRHRNYQQNLDESGLQISVQSRNPAAEHESTHGQLSDQELSPNAGSAHDVADGLVNGVSVKQFLDDLNHDTITSLHQFMTSAMTVRRKVSSPIRQPNFSADESNNASIASLPTSAQENVVSLQVELPDQYKTMSCASSIGGQDMQALGKVKRRFSAKYESPQSQSASNWSFQHQRSPTVNLSTSSVPAILRDITFEEIFRAAENVRQREEQSDSNNAP